MIVAAATWRGEHRTRNEDAVRWRITGVPVGAVLVADGMGGMGNGERASAIACDVITELLPSAPPLDHDRFSSWARDVCAVAHHRIRAEAHALGSAMQTTFVAAFLSGNRYIVAHLGDSRAYLVHGSGVIEQLTADHHTDSDGEPTRGGGGVTRSLGGVAVDPVALTGLMVAAPGDRLVLTTDGLTGSIRDPIVQSDEILACASTQPSAADVVASLLNAARARRTKDNVSVALIDFSATLGKPSVAPPPGTIRVSESAANATSTLSRAARVPQPRPRRAPAVALAACGASLVIGAVVASRSARAPGAELAGAHVTGTQSDAGTSRAELAPPDGPRSSPTPIVTRASTWVVVEVDGGRDGAAIAVLLNSHAGELNRCLPVDEKGRRFTAEVRVDGTVHALDPDSECLNEALSAIQMSPGDEHRASAFSAAAAPATYTPPSNPERRATAPTAAEFDGPLGEPRAASRQRRQSSRRTAEPQRPVGPPPARAPAAPLEGKLPSTSPTQR